jgi:tetratricopeptide (TPR) repeat protein
MHICQPLRLHGPHPWIVALALLLIAAPSATAQSRPGRPPRTSPQGMPAGSTREQMWRAPTSEEWAKPCLVTFQRTWEDAVAISKETEKPILICVNMDGEPASEHYAGVRYREPEKAALYEPYVCVIASVYRHSPRDFDDQGRRVLCPRFGSVTCGEHITIEPFLYERYFDGQRVAPRHIMVELDGAEVYDIFFAFDTDSVFTTLKDGIAERAIQGKTIVRGDRPILERVASRDNVDRTAVEKAYLEGDAALRQALLDAAAKHDDASPVDLLRLGVFGFDVELSRVARAKLAESKSEGAVELIPEALRLPMEEKERQALVAALTRLGDASTSERAQWLSVVHSGLSSRSTTVDVDGWASALVGAEYPADPDDWMELENKLETTSQRIEAQPEDGKTRLELAETALYLGLEGFDAFGAAPRTEQLLTTNPGTARMIARSKLSEARNAVLEAERLGEKGWRVSSVKTLSAYYLGDVAEAYRLAEGAVDDLPEGATDWNAMAILTIFAEGRFQAIKEAVREKKRWPGRWLADVHSAYSVLLHHPLATDGQVVWHYDFLTWLGAKEKADRFLSEGLRRFPESALLHDRLRVKILEEKGADGLEPAYATLLDGDDTAPSLRWYAGLASFLAAEYHRRKGEAEKGRASYASSITHFEKAMEVDPECDESAIPYIALALAGQARIAFEGGDYDRAVTRILASFKRDPWSGAVLDGLNLSPVDTARMLRARLLELDRKDLLQRLQDALDGLDPELLKLPAYESIGGGTR